jgi:hypothetical protein
MFREIAQILLAIQLSTSNMPAVREAQLAKVISQQAEVVGVDPLLFVSVISHESLWDEHAVSKDGLDIGLMQIRVQHVGGNTNYLFYGENNIRVGGYLMKKDMEFCRKKLGREPSLQEWLSVYQGSRPSCKPSRLTKRVEDNMLCLQKALENPNPYDMQLECKRVYNPNLAR